MKRYLSPGFLLFAACATAPVSSFGTGRGHTVAGEPHVLAAPVRLETRSGTEDLESLLAGEPTRQRYTAGVLLAGA
ncbi:hypothetical protein [Comamonas sp. JC664]|uniref:hypothetical protein n=1 Tax=Comamonas sp. JC664 TaxID=2801917 RepID=UPI00174A90F6|nr:hypothetical protein [Comamonas sp. JC664]MBL0692708.1 hypothetical protein [Comamonas sp. JC664]GHG93383.1 hypothetical protein GCM10012319_55750 [Comamonas sp. KCTC 72670]